MRLPVAAMMACALAACTPAHHSADFDALQSLDRTQWAARAKSMPLPQRLALYDEVYFSRVHPRDPSLASAFAGEGRQGLAFVLARMDSEATFREYLPIIHTLSDDLDICDPAVLGPLQQAAVRVGIDDKERQMIGFLHCNLLEG